MELLAGVIYDARPDQLELVERVARSLTASFGDVVFARSPLQLPPRSVLVPEVLVPDGRCYRTVRTLARDDLLAPTAFENIRIPVADIL